MIIAEKTIVKNYSLRWRLTAEEGKMATGQNFTRIQGQGNSNLNRLKKELEELKDENEKIVKRYKEEGNLDSELCANIEKIKYVEWLIYCEEYDDNNRRNWK
jgi:hypothetical protein